ncbi:MAG: MarR family transcriptional regulator [Polyangiaceae bacterium]|nr:MarR family transcriptional regulator [Polyangiaceae bacterium]
MADQERFVRALSQLSRELARVGRERAREHELTPQQSETLLLVAEKGAVSTSLLATLLGIDPSTASRNLAGLERDGYIQRKKGTDDGRQTDVRLTPRGKRAADGAHSAAKGSYESFLEKVSRGDRSRVVDALETLTKAFESK